MTSPSESNRLSKGLARQWLEALVAIPSPSGEEADIACYCEDLLSQWDFEVSRQPLADGRFNILAKKGKGPALLLYAHMDTVPPDPAYTHDPFQVRYTEDRALGLGVSDMKSGLAVILEAARTAHPEGYTLKIALGVDEEAFSQGAWQLVSSQWLSDVALALVPELVIDSNVEQLGLGRAGFMAFQLVTHGPRQHGAVPLETPSAIERALEAVAHLKAFPLRPYPLQDLSERLIVHGIQARVQGLTHPSRCEVDFAIFLSPERSAEQVHEQLKQHFAHIPHVELQPAPRPTPVANAYTVSASHPLVKFVQDQYASLKGKPLPVAHGWSVADENVLQSVISGPVLSLAPVGGYSHRVGEWLDLKSFTTVVSLYKNILTQAGTYLEALQ